MSYLETRDVCSDSTQLDISYATFYAGHFSSLWTLWYLVVPENTVVICVE